MIFVDEARIFVKAGDGGKGCESFYSDRYKRHPVPDGGDGGRGGDIVVMAHRSMQTLLDYRYKQHYKAPKGGNGSSRSKTGKNGAASILRVPLGTVLWDHDTKLLIKDLVKDQQSVVVAKGGEPGRGNAHGKTAKIPGLGEERTIRLELKLIAEVGLVGFPNAGKSTLVCGLSKVRSKIANYPFTTKRPVLGVVPGEDFDFTLADLPGLIEGAHKGKGLGDKFLKHAERTQILVHVLDMAGSEGRDPLEDYEQINHELEQYSDKLFLKHKVVAANKMDLPQASENLKRFQKKYPDEKVFSVSALNKEGFDDLVIHLREILCQENSRARSNAS